MKKIYLLVVVLAAITSCRKDNSAFLNASSKAVSANGDKCLIVLSKDIKSGFQSATTYQSDSIFASNIISKGLLSDEYLVKERDNVYLYSNGTKELKDVKYRVYLNSFGAVEKEVNVVLNADKKTFREVASEKNLYIYNSKHQLIKMYRELDPNDVSFFELSYDSENRINKILVYEEEGGSLYFTYNNFKFSTQKKKDNFYQVAMHNSIGTLFIPSLRNVYITHYETFFEGFGKPADTYDFDLTFENGNLSKMKTSYVVFGTTVNQEIAYTVNCK